MKNHSNSENNINAINKYTFAPLNDNYFHSLLLQSYDKKIINKKRNREFNNYTMLDKINNLELNQNITNNKLDLILSILNSKLLGKYDFKISHYDLCLIQPIKAIEEKEIKSEEEKKEDNNIESDEIEYEHNSQIKKEPNVNLHIIERKNLFGDENNKQNMNIISSGNDNLKEMINDFLCQTQNEKTVNNENLEQNGDGNIVENEKEDNKKIEENENIKSIKY